MNEVEAEEVEKVCPATPFNSPVDSSGNSGEKVSPQSFSRGRAVCAIKKSLYVCMCI